MPGCIWVPLTIRTACAKQKKSKHSLDFYNGAKRTRTADPLHAMQVLYQLSYGPMIKLGSRNIWWSSA